MHGVVCLVRSAQLYAVRCDSRAAWTVAADPTADRDRGNANLGVSAPGLLAAASLVRGLHVTIALNIGGKLVLRLRAACERGNSHMVQAGALTQRAPLRLTALGGRDST